MHPVISEWNGFKVKVPHTVDLQLECQCWLQVSIDTILNELEITKLWGPSWNLKLSTDSDQFCDLSYGVEIFVSLVNNSQNHTQSFIMVATKTN
jgi:hypothetical protein